MVEDGNGQFELDHDLHVTLTKYCEIVGIHVEMRIRWSHQNVSLSIVFCDWLGCNLSQYVPKSGITNVHKCMSRMVSLKCVGPYVPLGVVF